jgi:hypothetical protein
MEYLIYLQSNANSLGDTIRLTLNVTTFTDQQIWDVAEAIRNALNFQFSGGAQDTVITLVQKSEITDIPEPS